MNGEVRMLESIIELLFVGGAASNKQHGTLKNTAKLDQETEELKHSQIPIQIGKAIQQGRQTKGISQKDLASVSD